MVGDIAVPTHFFKVIILEKENEPMDVECYIVQNTNTKEQQNKEKIKKENKVELDEIEKKSGLVFSEKSQNVKEKSERVSVHWSAKEKISEIHNVDMTFTITPSQISKEQVF